MRSREISEGVREHASKKNIMGKLHSCAFMTNKALLICSYARVEPIWLDGEVIVFLGKVKNCTFVF